MYKESETNITNFKCCDMTPESWNSSFLGNDSVNIPAEANAHNKRTSVFSVVRAKLVLTQRWGKYASAAVNQHATTEKAVFSVGAAPTLYNEDLRHVKV
jgi:hypothetical protein